jgi:phosphatidylserine/phosphatidylglycerophosphate/cardiolipin synthase-like enzyme
MHRIGFLLALALAGPAIAAPADVSVCFVPAEACADRIEAAIDGAASEIRVQAYGFTARGILAALVRAKARGVDVAVLLDKSDERGKRAGLSAMLDAGIPVAIDRVGGIAHVKAIVIDRRLVIGGSYNYTASAERRNVEDVTITESPAVAALFLAEWQARQAQASPPD